MLIKTYMLLIGLFAAFSLSSEASTFTDECISNQKMISYAKVMCAIDDSISDGKVIDETRLYKYLDGGLPLCPNGGDYIINPVGEDAVCSLDIHQPAFVAQMLRKSQIKDSLYAVCTILASLVIGWLCFFKHFKIRVRSDFKKHILFALLVLPGLLPHLLSLCVTIPIAFIKYTGEFPAPKWILFYYAAYFLTVLILICVYPLLFLMRRIKADKISS